MRFEKIARFYNTYFKDIANFYFAIFEYVPNFSMCAFEKANLVNLIGVDLSLIDVKIIRDYINEVSNIDKQKNDSNNIFKAYHYYLIQHSQGTKDSFRAIKNVLITQSNLLESQKWHQLELYAQEVELGYRIKTKNIDEECKNNSDNESQRILKINYKNKIKNMVDWLQLWLYKITSNHHSDLFLILFTTLSVIGGYYLFNVVIEFYYFKFNYWDLFKYCFYSLITYIVYCLVLAFIECILKKDFKKYKFIYFISYALLIFSVLGIWNEPRVVTPFIGVFSDNAKNHFLNKAITNLEDYQAISIAKRLNPNINYLNESQAKKDLLASKDIIKEDEKILKAYDNALQKGKNADEIMARINIIYYILMILCLFSLQKTARKNSIIPN